MSASPATSSSLRTRRNKSHDQPLNIAIPPPVNFEVFFETFDIDDDVPHYLHELDIDRYLTNLEIATFHVADLRPATSPASMKKQEILLQQIKKACGEFNDETDAIRSALSRMKLVGLDVQDVIDNFSYAEELILDIIRKAEREEKENCVDVLIKEEVRKEDVRKKHGETAASKPDSWYIKATKSPKSPSQLSRSSSTSSLSSSSSSHSSKSSSSSHSSRSSSSSSSEKNHHRSGTSEHGKKKKPSSLTLSPSAALSRPPSPPRSPSPKSPSSEKSSRSDDTESPKKRKSSTVHETPMMFNIIPPTPLPAPPPSPKHIKVSSEPPSRSQASPPRPRQSYF